jgi:hypothetical protein
MKRHVKSWLAAAPLLWLSGPANGATVDAGRPILTVSAPAFACPATEGAFVALLDPGRGMLLLSAAEFPGGRAVGKATGAALAVALPGRGDWALSSVGTSAGSGTLWGAGYRVPVGEVGGCVAFDRQQFSSEGDLVTYAQWLINDVYLRLPKVERETFPALRLSDRTVRLRLQLAGHGTVTLEDMEGATMPVRVPGGPQTLLVRPFVLDEATARVAIDLSITDQPYWLSAQKRPLGFVAASPSQPATLADPALTIQVETVSAPTADASAAR